MLGDPLLCAGSATVHAVVGTLAGAGSRRTRHIPFIKQLIIKLPRLALPAALPRPPCARAGQVGRLCRRSLGAAAAAAPPAAPRTRAAPAAAAHAAAARRGVTEAQLLGAPRHRAGAKAKRVVGLALALWGRERGGTSGT